MKICSKCNKELNEQEFYKDKRAKDGLTVRCKLCIKKYYEDNKVAITVTGKEYRRSNKDMIVLYRQGRKVEITKYIQSSAGKEARARASRKYRQTPAGKAAERRAQHKRRGFGFSPINNAFENSHAHHIHINNSSDVIYMTSELHRSVAHNSFIGKGMDEINELALDWILSDEQIETISVKQLSYLVCAFNI